MLNINFEFRKGIFFIRFIGDLNKESSKQNDSLLDLINESKFKYIVVNTNYIKNIDLSGLNYLTKIYYITKENECNLIICDKFKIIKELFNNNIPSIENEIEVL